MKKRFKFFQCSEGGMDVFDIYTKEDLEAIAYWMDKTCIKQDNRLIKYMENMEVGDFVKHRMGILVRLKNIIT